MAFTSVSTKRRTEWNTTEVIQVLSGGGGTGQLIFAEGLPYATAQIVLTSGTAITNIQLQLSNDGIAANAVNSGTAITTLPAAAVINAAEAAWKYHQWVISGGDATTVVTITENLMGSRG